MCAAACRSALVFAWLALCAVAALAQPPMRERKPVQLVSTVDAAYRLVQQDEEIGREKVTRKVYDDNTMVFEVASSARMAGATFSFNSTLVVDEESFFPRSLRSARVIAQPADTMRIAFTVEMYANVAVVGSDIQGRTDSRRIVVPTGVPVVELGAAYSWYPIVYWTDFAARERQRFQFLDPQLGRVESGEIQVSGEQTIDVMGKKTTVTVLKAERERMGPAVLFVDAARRIVRCEQNVTVFELTEWREK